MFPTGHIGIFVGSKSQKKVCSRIAAWLKPRSVMKGTGDVKLEQSGKKYLYAKEKVVEQKEYKNET
ncbi:MAG: hypothetical protein ABOK23_10760 [Candidatus Methanoperedens sp.]|nr:hypothetical protein [Candidatus Methanoperedens sp.]